MPSNKAKITLAAPTKRDEQLEYIQRIVLRAILRHPKSGPFREPVDPIKHNAEDYYDVVKQPMDLGTIRFKLLNDQYKDAEECIKDFRLIFSNCFAYNSDGLPIFEMCKHLEEFFNEKIKSIPQKNNNVGESTKVKEPEDEVVHPVNKAAELNRTKKRSKEPLSKSLIMKKKKIEETINSVLSSDVEISTNVSVSQKKDSKKSTVVKKSNGVNSEAQKSPCSSNVSVTQSLKKNSRPCISGEESVLKYCSDLVKDLLSRKHQDYAWPFYEPVNVTALNLSDYHSIVHFPADLSTIKKKLDLNIYNYGFDCITELRRMVCNSFRYNPEGHSVHSMGEQLLLVIENYISKAPIEIYDRLVIIPEDRIRHVENAKENKISDSGSASIKTDQSKDESHSKGGKTKKKAPSFENVSENKDVIANASSNKKVEVEEEEDYVNPITSKAIPANGSVLEVIHAEPMTYDEMRKLAMDINRLPTDKLADILALLLDLEANVFKEKNSSEVEIDLDRMKPETLRYIEKCVKNFNRPSKSRKKKLPNSTINKNKGKEVQQASQVVGNKEVEYRNSKDEDYIEVVNYLQLSEESEGEDGGKGKSKGIVANNLLSENKKGKETELSRNVNEKSKTEVSMYIDDSLLPECMLNKPTVTGITDKTFHEEEALLNKKIIKPSKEVVISEERDKLRKEEQQKRMVTAGKTKSIISNSDLMSYFEGDL